MHKSAKAKAIECVSLFAQLWQQRLGNEPFFMTVGLLNLPNEGGAFTNEQEILNDPARMAAEMRRTAARLLNQADWLDGYVLRGSDG